MFKKLRRRNPGAPLWKILWWILWESMFWCYLCICYRYRYDGQKNIPDEGPVLLICNHQSFLDLPVVGVGIWHRHFHSMARLTLFKGLLGWQIRALNGFPVDQESTGDIKAMRAAMGQLEKGHLLLVFPEGSRSPDGAMGQFHKGIMLIIRRSKPTVVPAAIEGVYDVWPTGQSLPKPRGRVATRYGKPIAAETLLAMDPDDALEHLRQEIDRMRLDLRNEMKLRGGAEYLAPGPADERVRPWAETAAREAV